MSGSLRTVHVMPHDARALLAALEAPGDMDPQVMEDAVEYIWEVLNDPSRSEIARGIMTHLECISPARGERLRQIIAQGGPGEGDTWITSAALLRAEGEPKGRVKALVQVLSRKFGMLPTDALRKLDAASVEQLVAWTERVFSATTLDEVFT
jgi:hypothetical protein